MYDVDFILRKIKLNLGKPPKKKYHKTSLQKTLFGIWRGSQQIFLFEPQKVVIFSYLELKNGRFWSLIGLRSMDLSLGRKGT